MVHIKKKRQQRAVHYLSLHAVIIYNSLDSEVISSQFGIIDLEHETSVFQGPLPHLTNMSKR